MAVLESKLLLRPTAMISGTRFICSGASRAGALRQYVRQAHSAVQAADKASKEVTPEELTTSNGSNGMTAARSMLKQHTFAKEEGTSSTQRTRSNPVSRGGEGEGVTGWFKDAKRSPRNPHSRGNPRYSDPMAKQNSIRPVVQSARIKELARKGEFGLAIGVVYKAPRRTVNTITWNTLLAALMAEGKRKEAFKVYTEVNGSA